MSLYNTFQSYILKIYEQFFISIQVLLFHSCISLCNFLLDQIYILASLHSLLIILSSLFLHLLTIIYYDWEGFFFLVTDSSLIQLSALQLIHWMPHINYFVPEFIFPISSIKSLRASMLSLTK